MADSDSSVQLPLWSEVDGPEAWVIRHSTRARRLTVRVLLSGRVEVVVPARTSAQSVARFVERHRAWIERKRREARRNAVPEQPFPPQRVELAAAGESWRLHLAGGEGRLRVHENAAGLLAFAGRLREPRELRRLLRTWLVARAREVLGAQLAQIAAEHGFRYARLAVRRQRTRWGSCSTRGTISLNCCLLFQPPEVVRYLLIHELAHTRHMNHSVRFWACVAQCCPEYQRLDRELLEGWRRVPSWVFDDSP